MTNNNLPEYISGIPTGKIKKSTVQSNYPFQGTTYGTDFSVEDTGLS